MPFCGAGVTLRTIALGTKHFTHALRGPCTTAPESAEHLLAKRTIVEGVRRSSWKAVAEHAGESQDAEPWIADVLATEEHRQVAFEVQWSRQEDAETRRRHRRYAASGVRVLWFFRQHAFPIEKEVPAFRLVFDEEASRFVVQLPSPEHNPWMSATDKDQPHYWRQAVELSRFVEGALNGRLRFAPALGLTTPVEVFTETTICWKCKKDTRLVLGITFAVNRVLPGCADIGLDLHSFGDNLKDGQPSSPACSPPPYCGATALASFGRDTDAPKVAHTSPTAAFTATPCKAAFSSTSTASTWRERSKSRPTSNPSGATHGECGQRHLPLVVRRAHLISGPGRAEETTSATPSSAIFIARIAPDSCEIFDRFKKKA